MQPQGIVSQPAGTSRGMSSSSVRDKKKAIVTAGLFLAVIIAGIFTGKSLAGEGSSTAPSGNTAPGATTSLREAGISDESTFRDSAEGTLREGGIEGDGTHHLERPGGASQNVYLTSTVIDLQSFVGKKVKVWGETISAKRASWLMDVGKISVTD